LIENLRREVKEETQLEIISEPKLICAQDIIPGDEKHIVRLSYIGDTNGEPMLDISENVDIYAKSIIDGGLLDHIASF
jgi:ADP-ribose pyrophosphatase YjhB (NUDIX family)